MSAPGLPSDDSPLASSAAQCLARIRDVLARSRGQALQAVNAAMVEAYWQIGREIVEEEQRGADRAAYGSRLIEELAVTLTTEFGKGFNTRNLWYMRDVYQAFPILNALRSELSWTHYRLLSRVADPEARAFYMQECAHSRWSTRELERQIASLLYERLALSTDKEGVRTLAEHGHVPDRPEDLVKDPYVLEFVGLPQTVRYTESDLEQALIEHLQKSCWNSDAIFSLSPVRSD
jgi:hypothetical protein